MTLVTMEPRGVRQESTRVDLPTMRAFELRPPPMRAGRSDTFEIAYADYVTHMHRQTMHISQASENELNESYSQARRSMTQTTQTDEADIPTLKPPALTPKEAAAAATPAPRDTLRALYEAVVANQAAPPSHEDAEDPLTEAREAFAEDSEQHHPSFGRLAAVKPRKR